ncbi:TPA: hypothetical protein DEP94_04005 [Candidatus Nomurabacteria bacterium]|nr:hypothetical protein [Candidatus Nomurabacteria bacterium]
MDTKRISKSGLSVAAKREAKAILKAHTCMCGCGNGGRIFDEAGDPTETGSALTEEERDQMKNGLTCGCPMEQYEEMMERAFTMMTEVAKEIGRVFESFADFASYLAQEEAKRNRQQKKHRKATR